MTDNNVRFVIRINLSELLTPTDFQTVYKLLFTDINKTQNIQALIHKICIKTRTKMTLNDDDNQDEILVYWKYNPNLVSLRSFESNLLGLYHEKKDRKI